MSKSRLFIVVFLITLNLQFVNISLSVKKKPTSMTLSNPNPSIFTRLHFCIGFFEKRYFIHFLAKISIRAPGEKPSSVYTLKGIKENVSRIR